MLLRRALQPAFQDVMISWHGVNEEEKEEDVIVQAPLKLPPIFNHQVYTVYAIVKSSNFRFVGVTLTV